MCSSIYFGYALQFHPIIHCFFQSTHFFLMNYTFFFLFFYFIFIFICRMTFFSFAHFILDSIFYFSIQFNFIHTQYCETQLCTPTPTSSSSSSSASVQTSISVRAEKETHDYYKKKLSFKYLMFIIKLFIIFLSKKFISTVQIFFSLWVKESVCGRVVLLAI